MHPSQTAIIVIPARLSSQRLPRKMLLADTGRPLLEHTWRAAQGARRASRVVVATDSDEIARAVERFGGECVLTSPQAPSGTARIVEALPRLPDAGVVVNVQGDEPELAASAIDLAIDLLDRCPGAGVATLVTPLRSREDLLDPAAVKAVLTPWREQFHPNGTTGRAIPDAWRAIYFSRSPVPAARDWRDDLLAAAPPLYWQHVGLYAYRRSVLEEWDDLPESRLAGVESLEQLRVIEAGIPIVAGTIEHAARGIDTPRDYAAFVARSKADP
ncbi:MAG: 3-deoxy-manno-octulosonate cytidylyltransferase [Planctomycetia bacterium]|nr:3-deoxy-manno-octulosonate cytidylyltransferase [Planctomycetia bacterium]